MLSDARYARWQNDNCVMRDALHHSPIHAKQIVYKHWILFFFFRFSIIFFCIFQYRRLSSSVVVLLVFNFNLPLNLNIMAVCVSILFFTRFGLKFPWIISLRVTSFTKICKQFMFEMLKWVCSDAVKWMKRKKNNSFLFLSINSSVLLLFFFFICVIASHLISFWLKFFLVCILWDV